MKKQKPTKQKRKPAKYSKPVNLPPVFDEAMKTILQVKEEKK
jgi:hypothetical protein